MSATKKIRALAPCFPRFSSRSTRKPARWWPTIFKIPGNFRTSWTGVKTNKASHLQPVCRLVGLRKIRKIKEGRLGALTIRPSRFQTKISRTSGITSFSAGTPTSTMIINHDYLIFESSCQKRRSRAWWGVDGLVIRKLEAPAPTWSAGGPRTCYFCVWMRDSRHTLSKDLLRVRRSQRVVARIRLGPKRKRGRGINVGDRLYPCGQCARSPHWSCHESAPRRTTRDHEHGQLRKEICPSDPDQRRGSQSK